MLALADYNPGTPKGVEETITVFENRVYATRNKMRSLRMQLANADKMDIAKLEEFLKLNDTLRQLEICLAEFRWQRNVM